MFYYLNNFLFFSIFGFFFETGIFSILNMHNQSGFMRLWWTPFYGTGIIIVLLSYKFFSKLNMSKKKRNIIMFIYFFIVLSILELLGGLALEYLHGYSMWSYEHIPFHIGKYISVGTSLLWTLMSFAYLYIIKKYSDKIMNKIPKFITIILTIIFIFDFLDTIINLLIIKAM